MSLRTKYALFEHSAVDLLKELVEVRLFIGVCCVCIIEYMKILRRKKNVS